MWVKTRGIVLHAAPYSDRQSIVHLYTEAFGRASYLVARSKGKKGAASRALFMPLSVLEIDVEHLPRRDLQRIKESAICFPLAALSVDPVRNALALFVAEVLFRTMKDPEPDARLFHFLYYAVGVLATTQQGIANYHLVFLFGLLYHLGIFPNVRSYREGYLLDMLNGVFVDRIPPHPHYLNKSQSDIFASLLGIRFHNMHLYAFSRHDRVRIVEHLLHYYRLHLPGFYEVKSFAVVQALFD